MRRAKKEEEEEEVPPLAVASGDERKIADDDSDPWRAVRERHEADAEEYAPRVAVDRRWILEEKNTAHVADEWLQEHLSANSKARVVLYMNLPLESRISHDRKLAEIVYLGGSVEFVNNNPSLVAIATLCRHDNIEALTRLKFVDRSAYLKGTYMAACLRSPNASYRAAGFLFARLYGGDDVTSSPQVDDCVENWIRGFSSLKGTTSWFHEEPAGPEYFATGEGCSSSFATIGRPPLGVPDVFHVRASLFQQTDSPSAYNKFLYHNQASKLNALCEFFETGDVLYTFIGYEQGFDDSRSTPSKTKRSKLPSRSPKPYASPS